jgi:hypothetical protein
MRYIKNSNSINISLNTGCDICQKEIALYDKFLDQLARWHIDKVGVPAMSDFIALDKKGKFIHNEKKKLPILKINPDGNGACITGYHVEVQWNDFEDWYEQNKGDSQ